MQGICTISLPLHSPRWLHLARLFQDGNFQLDDHDVRRSASSPMHVQRPLDLPFQRLMCWQV